MRTKLLPFAFLCSIPSTLCAHEGMWVPTLLASIQDDMQAEGLRLTAEDIYSVNNSSIKDAIVLFGGGCTAEVISKEGLILTNHHCGFSAIQSHSSVENDYLKNGFWAMQRSEELQNRSLTASFVIRMEDVTERVRGALAGADTEAARKAAIEKVGAEIAEEAVKGGHFTAVVRAFNYGNSFFLIVSETFRDVRLVGAPPNGVGKFGADTDNWMWPRHTGDFSLFRIYAGSDNKPADPGAENKPFVPRHALPISLSGVQSGDMAMIFGFPGSTQRYLTSYTVQHVMEVQDPMRISMRKASLAVIDQAMRSSDRTRIQYAAKQSSISNAYKKWIGEVRGLKELHAVQRKQEFEAEYLRRVASSADPSVAEVLPRLKDAQERITPYSNARDLFIEFVIYGPEVLRFAERFQNLVEEGDRLKAEGKLQEEVDRLRNGLPGYFKDYDVQVDEKVFKALLPIYRKNIDPTLGPDALQAIEERFKGNSDAYVEDLYARSPLVSEEKIDRLLANWSKKSAKALANDPAYRLSRSLYAGYLEKVRPNYVLHAEQLDVNMRSYVGAMMNLFPERTFWPDANGTLRLSYGHVEGSEPRDAVVYGAFTHLSGIVEKHVPGDAEFEVPQGLLDLYRAKDFGPYGGPDDMSVCFTASLHTTGGNSGSPVLDGHGNLIGLNFDRTWESTMSDILFDPAKCRNIAVDIRYVLFIVDKYAGAKHLIDEMELVRVEAGSMVIDLPIHR